MAETPKTIKQVLTGELQLKVDGPRGTSRLVNLGRISIPYEVNVTAAIPANRSGIPNSSEGTR